jgi:hypothetical protein
LDILLGYLETLRTVAEGHGYEYLFFGDYAMASATGGAVFPNRALRDAGLFRVREVKGMAYPDFFSSRAAAISDHEVAHVVTTGDAATREARSALAELPGLGEILDREDQRQVGLNHPRSGELVLVAEPGRWFAYPWWTTRAEAPDFAAHVDIHNKPGYDPCELFFGWPPMSVSQDTGRIRGTHGRVGPERQAAWASSATWDPLPQTVIELARSVQEWLTPNP